MVLKNRVVSSEQEHSSLFGGLKDDLRLTHPWARFHI